MATTTADIVHTPKHYATEVLAVAGLGTGRWGYAQDTRRRVINDAGTFRYYWDSTRQADTTGDDVTGMTYGAGIVGSAGITGVTPRGGSSGSTGTVYDMLVGLRDYASGTFVDGSGTAGKIPIWSDSDTIGDSIISYVNGVFDVIYPTSGAVTTWRATNTSNTAGSGACVIVGVQGSSATGDAFFGTQVAGTLNYVIGYDVSATLFTASAGTVLGTGNIFTADGTTFNVVDNLNVGGSNFTVAAASGNTSILGTLDITGLVSGAAGFLPTGGSGTKRMYFSQTDGLVVRGAAGSTPTNDFSIYTAAGNYLFQNPTGTANITLGHSTASLTIPPNTTVTRSSSGATVFCAVSNTSNTASAASIFRATAAGSTAAGAGDEYIITGGTTWAVYAKGSDSSFNIVNNTLGSAGIISIKSDASSVSIGSVVTHSYLSQLTVRADSLGVSVGAVNVLNGISVHNATAAAAGAQQGSPGIHWRGNGWKTNATAASQTVTFMSYVIPVQGAAAPTGYLRFGAAINVDSSDTEILRLDSGGGVEAPGYFNAARATATAAGGSTVGFMLGTSPGLIGIYWGSGAPTISALQGSIYLRTDGSSTSTRLYVNTNGTTGWTNFTSAT